MQRSALNCVFVYCMYEPSLDFVPAWDLHDLPSSWRCNCNEAADALKGVVVEYVRRWEEIAPIIRLLTKTFRGGPCTASQYLNWISVIPPTTRQTQAPFFITVCCLPVLSLTLCCRLYLRPFWPFWCGLVQCQVIQSNSRPTPENASTSNYIVMIGWQSLFKSGIESLETVAIWILISLYEQELQSLTQYS